MAAFESPGESLITSSACGTREGNGDFSDMLGMGTARAGMEMDNLAMPRPTHTEGWTTILFFFFFFFGLFRAAPAPLEVPRLGVESDL